MRPAILFFKLFILSLCGKAQQEVVVLQHISAKNGLSSNGINALLKDKRGFLWIGTVDGLNRFDGMQTKSFGFQLRNNHSLSHNWITSLVNDNNGNIWIGTRNGVCQINPYSLEITRILTEKKTEENDILLVNNIVSDANGKIWAATSMGLFLATPSGLKEFIVIVKNKPVLKPSYRSIAFDQNGNMFLAFENKMLVLSPGSSEAEEIIINAGKKEERRNIINTFFIIPNGNVWISTLTNKLFQLNFAGRKIVELPEPGSFTSFSSPGRNNYFLAGNAKGVYQLDVITEKLTSLKVPGSVLRQLDKAGVNVVLYDKDDGLWIGTGQGIYLLEVKKKDIRFISFADILQQVEKKEVVTAAFIVNRPSCLFVSMIDSGYFFYNTSENKKMPVPEELLPWLPSRINIEQVEQAPDGRVFFVSPDAGVVEWEPVLQKAITLNKKYNTEIFSNVFFVLSDSGYIWASGKNGILQFDKKTGISKTFKIMAGNRLGIPYTFNYLKRDSKGIIWCMPKTFKSRKPFVGRIIPGSDTIQLFFHNSRDITSLPAYDQLSEIEIDKNDTVWCTASNGLISWASTMNKPVFRLFTSDDGLSNNRMYSVLADQEGKIWCGTAYGLTVYNPGKNFFSNYFKEDGLSRDIIFHLDKGLKNEIIAASWAGIDIIPATGLKTQQPAGAPLITDIRINNNEYQLSKDELRNNKPIGLTYRQNMISIGFVWPGYRNPGNITYAYKLSGVDDDWIKTRSNAVSYANLREGKYVFEIKIINSIDLSSEKTTRLVFSIKPPFWRTWWFITACILLTITIGYFLFMMRINRIKERFRLRNKIAADLHDEIGSTLTSISILSNVSQQAFDKEPAKAKEMLQQIALQSKTVQQNMSDIVWAIRPDNEKLENMLVRMREYAAQTLEPLNIKTNIAIEGSLLSKTMPLAYRKEVLLLYKEAINNIAKHSGAAAVNINMEKTGNVIRMTIKDNGRWKGNGKTSGTGLMSMQQRARTLGGELKLSNGNEGTTVELDIALP